MAELSFEHQESQNRFPGRCLNFENLTIEAVDDRADYGEVRHIALGLSGGKVLNVVYTWRDENVISIISARRANRHDAEKYYREIFS